MKTILTLFTILFSVILCAQKPTETKQATTKQTINFTDAKGKKQGKWAKNHEKLTSFVYEGQFKDDKPFGIFTYYYASGKVKAIIVHDDKTDRSSAVMYHESKKIMATGIYKGELKDSVWTFYDPTGRIASSDTYKTGKLNGMRYIYFVPNALNDKRVAVAKQYNYINDKEEGEYIEYFEEGGIKNKGNYKSGYKHGLCTLNHPGGKKMLEERFKLGKKHGWQRTFDKAGVELGNRYFRNGIEVKGKVLDKMMADFKKRGVSPNE